MSDYDIVVEGKEKRCWICGRTGKEVLRDIKNCRTDYKKIFPICKICGKRIVFVFSQPPVCRICYRIFLAAIHDWNGSEKKKMRDSGVLALLSLEKLHEEANEQ